MPVQIWLYLYKMSELSSNMLYVYIVTFLIVFSFFSLMIVTDFFISTCPLMVVMPLSPPCPYHSVISPQPLNGVAETA